MLRIMLGFGSGLRLEQLLRIFRALQTSRVLYISMNAHWCMNQLLIASILPMFFSITTQHSSIEVKKNSHFVPILHSNYWNCNNKSLLLLMRLSLSESSSVRLSRKRFKNDLSPNIELNACTFSFGQKKHPTGHFQLPVRMHWRYAYFELKTYFRTHWNVKYYPFLRKC